MHTGRAGTAFVTTMGPMDDDINEFSAIAAEARDWGLGDRPPSVTRTEFPIRDEGMREGVHRSGVVSTLVWSRPARVLLLHGAALNAHTWDATLVNWGVPALAVDLPGHGRSTWWQDGDYSPATLARRLASVIDRAVSRGVLLAPFVLVGHSLGGLTGIELAAHRDDIERLILLDILPLEPSATSAVESFLAGPAVFSSREDIVERALAFGLGGDREESVRRSVVFNTRIRPDGRVEWRHHLATLGPSALGLHDPEAQWQALASITGGIDVVAGRRGLVSPRDIDRLRAVSPASTVTWTETGHNIQEDAPDELARILTALVAAEHART